MAKAALQRLRDWWQVHRDVFADVHALQRLRDWWLEVRISMAQANLRKARGEEIRVAAEKFLRLVGQRSEAQKQRMEQARFKRIVGHQ